jgi:hypothetical protein
LHNDKKYFWYDYLALFILPGYTLYLLYRNVGGIVLWVFFFWVVFGPILEFVVGKSYLNLKGKHLWVYEKLPLFNKTTSWLSIPYWAFAGLGIWAANQVLTQWLR